MPHKRKELKIEGPSLWYLVGLITSDGCLSSDARHIDITSSEKEYLEELKERLELTSKVCIKNKGTQKQSYRIQIANKNFYDFLLSVGLMPNKSLIIKELTIPDEFFADFLRGVIDGDGGIQHWIHPTNKHEQWNLRISSGSRSFLYWLQREIEKNCGVTGRLYAEKGKALRLKYGKMAARIIAGKCYYKQALALKRKKDLARDCIRSYLGWRESKTIIN